MSAVLAHRVHGMGTTLEAPVWPAIRADEAAAVLARFPAAGTLAAVEWHSPRPFSAAALVRTGAGTLLLKRHHARVRDVAALAEEHAFIAHLRGRGIGVPDILATVGGASAVALGEWVYEVQRQAPGLDLYRDAPSWTPFRSHAHAEAAGAALARVHLAAEGFDAPARGARPLVGSMTILPAADPLAAAAAYVAARPALAGFLAGRDWRGVLTRLFATFGAGLPERLAHVSGLWTHNDWHPSNLLWNADGGVATVFDFGLATRTCALHDLAIAIERTAFDWLALDRDSAGMACDADAARALLRGYHRVSPLDAAQRETIARILPLIHVEFALSEIDYFAGIVGNMDDAALAWDGYLIGHADWFGSAAARDFLAAIAR